MANETKVLRLRRGDRAVLESWLRSRTLPRRLLERAEIVLAAADGLRSRAVAETVGVARATAILGIRRYEAEGLGGIERDRPRPGRPRTITREIEEAVIEKTVNEKPPPEVALALVDAAHGQGDGPEPGRGRTHLAQVRPQAAPDQALQAVARSAPGREGARRGGPVPGSPHPCGGLQLRREEPDPGAGPDAGGRAGTMTHDSKRHGTTTLCAALNVATGETIHECMPRHRHQEFLRFLRTLERSVEPGLDIHVTRRTSTRRSGRG